MRRRSKWVLAGIGILIVVLGTWYGVALARSTARLRAAYAALQNDGRPMRADEMTPAKVPDEQNAAVLYEKAASMLKAQPFSPTAREKDLLKRLANLSDAPFRKTDDPDKLARQKQDVAELKQLMAQDVVVQAISLIEQGTQRPACRFDHDYGRVTSFSLPATDDLRDLISVVGAQVYLEAQAGRSEKAWSMIPTMLRFADAPGNEPGVAACYNRSGMIRYSCATAQRLCETAPPDGQTYRRIESLLTSYDDVKPFIRALDAERLLIGEPVFSLPDDELFEAMRKDPHAGQDREPTLGYRMTFRRVTFRPRFIADHAAYLEAMRKHTLLYGGPYAPKDSQAHKEIDRLLNQGYITGKLLPSIWGDQWIYCRAVAFIRITRAGLAAIQYKQAHGTWPPSLDSLGLKDATDPFTQQPLHYRAEGGGFIVYSVDEDQQDNGGITEPLEPRGGRDIVWRFPETK